jgi:hypothetical protein
MVSGTGHAGMEAAIANLVEPGDKVVVGTSGIWGSRVADLSQRYHGALVALLAVVRFISVVVVCVGCVFSGVVLVWGVVREVAPRTRTKKTRRRPSKQAVEHPPSSHNTQHKHTHKNKN